MTTSSAGGCGRVSWTGRFLGRALEGSGALFLGELRRELALGLRRNYQVGPAALQSRRSPCGSPTRTSGVRREGRRDRPGVHPRRRGIRGDRAAARAGVGRRDRRGRPGVGRARPRQPLDRRWRGPRDRRDPAARASVPGGAAMDRDVPASGPGGRGSGALGRRPGTPTDPARLGRRAAPPARFPAGWGRRVSRDITSASAAATARRCWACSSPFRSRGRCSRESNWQAAGLTPCPAAFPGGGWTAGVRAGVGAETPVGPVRFEYGVALRGRDALFVRLGRWF